MYIMSSKKKKVEPKKKIEVKKITSVQKYKKKVESDEESDDEIIKKSDDESKVECVNCIKCDKELNLREDVIYDYCENCNTLLTQLKLENFVSVFNAIDAQLKLLYNENIFLKDKIRIIESTQQQLIQQK